DTSRKLPLRVQGMSQTMKSKASDSAVLEQFSDANAVEDSPPTLAQSLWGGTKSGFRRSLYFACAIGFLLSIPGIALMLFAMAAGRGWSVPAYVSVLWAGCGVGMLAGSLVGAIFGLLRAVLTRTSPAKASASGQTAVETRKGVSCSTAREATA